MDNEITRLIAYAAGFGPTLATLGASAGVNVVTGVIMGVSFALAGET
jgi:hypothetical protein